MAFLEAILSTATNNPVTSIVASLVVLLLIRSIGRVYFHPLSHIPGPLLPKITSLWLYYHAYVGDEASIIHLLHQIYGPYVRVSPDEVDISDADAVNPIYISKGGFMKASCYANFDIDAHKTVFSTEETEYRGPRAKAVMPMFATKSIRENEKAIAGCVERMVGRLEEEARSDKAVNLLNITRSLAVDVVSTHLFGRNYDGISEKGPTLSVSAFVDAFVGVGRFFYLPNWIFVWVDWGIAKFLPDHGTSESMALVDRFVEDLVDGTTEEMHSYGGRLLAAGIQRDEVKAQCKDLIFAGTDSTGMNLATLCRYLALYPEKYARLREEVTANAKLGSGAQDVQSLPYLSAVVKEGLRLSMANPTRLPRLVPPTGWTFKDTYFPPNTIVGCAAYSLHFDPVIFEDPHAFKPERWLEEDGKGEERNKSWFAFGAGSRACIARNLATVELIMATERIARSGVLEGARALDDEVKIYEWFNSRVKGEKVELIWDKQQKTLVS